MQKTLFKIDNEIHEFRNVETTNEEIISYVGPGNLIFEFNHVNSIKNHISNMLLLLKNKAH